MTIKQKLLQAKGDELSRLLGEILQPIDPKNRCRGCAGKKEGWCNLAEPCTEPYLPVPLDDWNVAMKWRDLAVRKYGIIEFGRALEEVFNSNGKVSAGCFFIYSYVQHKHILKAAAICILKGRK